MSSTLIAPKSNSSLLHLKTLLSSIGLFALFCYATNPSLAQEKETLLVASRINTPPFVFGKFKGGIDMEILAAIEERSNLQFEYVHLPRKRMVAPFEGTNLDGYLIQPKNTNTDGCVTDWYIQHLAHVVTLKEKRLKIENVNDLANLKIISFDGASKYLSHAFRKATRNNPNYVESYHQQSHIEILYKGRFDAIVSDSLVIKYHQKNHFDRTGEYHAMESHNILDPVQISARFKNPEHCKQFNSALKEIKANGVYDQILYKYEHDVLEITQTPSR